MSNAENYYKLKDGSHFTEICEQAENQDLSGWQEYYWAGLYLYEYAPDGTYYELIVDTIEESFFEGLSYLSDATSYLEAVRILGRVYLELQQYDLALNMFQMLILKDSSVPAWVYLRYAYAQLHSDTVKRLIDEPEYLFERLDKIDNCDQALIAQRNAIFQEYLELCTKYYDIQDTEVDIDALFDKAAEYGVIHTEAWKVLASRFAGIYGSDIEDELIEDVELEEEPEDEEISSQGHLSKESKKRIYDFICLLIEKHSDDLTDSKKVQGLAADLLSQNAKEKNIMRLSAIEGAFSSMSYAIGGEEIKQRIAFSNSRKILIERCGFSDTVATDVVVEMAKAMNFIIDFDGFENECNDADEAISDFSTSLVNDLEQENIELMNKIHELQNQMSELLRKNQDFEQLLEEKKEIIDQLTANEACIDNITRNAANGINNGHDLLDGNKKILVIGQTVVSKDKLLGIVKNYGYQKSDFIFWDDYDKIKSYADRMVGGSFTGIIAGPMPHKVSGLGDYSSLIEKMKKPGYPYMEEARSESGELKITKNSFRKALEGLTKHLLAIQ